MKHFTTTRIFLITCWLGIYCTIGCTDDDSPAPPENSLLAYLEANDLELQLDSLIACAASGQEGILADPGNAPISIIYLPLTGVTDVRYFESEGIPANPTDYALYQEKLFVQAPLLNGFLRKFTRVTPDQAVYGLVSFVRKNKVFLSNPIHLKASTQPTDFTTAIATDLTDPLMPAFSWENLDDTENAIYFQVVSDVAGNLISGTYTTAPNFQFYNLDNVVLNINDITPAPSLTPGEDYQFTVLGVSQDNWVNLHATVAFSVP